MTQSTTDASSVSDFVAPGFDPQRIATLRSQLRGSVALVGCGPGDPGLLTLRAAELLAAADVVLYDHLTPPLASIVPTDAELIDVAKLPYTRSITQEKINELLIEHAQAGRFVVRAKGGDPYVFGRGHEERAAATEAGIAVTVVPGISSPISVPELVGIPVTNRGVNHEFTILSGHLPPGHPKSLINWQALAGMRGTLAIVMGVKNGGAIADALIDGGRSPQTPAAVVQEGAMPGQRVVSTTLDGLAVALETCQPPAVIVIGEVAGL